MRLTLSVPRSRVATGSTSLFLDVVWWTTAAHTKGVCLVMALTKTGCSLCLCMNIAMTCLENMLVKGYIDGNSFTSAVMHGSIPTVTIPGTSLGIYIFSSLGILFPIPGHKEQGNSWPPGHLTSNESELLHFRMWWKYFIKTGRFTK